MDEPITIARNDEHSRYEIHVGDVLAGFTQFEPLGEGRLLFPHTVIDHAYRGRGLAGALVAQAMADVAAHGETVVPECPVVERYLREHEVPGLRVEWPEAAPWSPE